jgi:hypothetical protein
MGGSHIERYDFIRHARIVTLRILTASDQAPTDTGRTDQRVRTRSLKPQVSVRSRVWNPTGSKTPGWPSEQILTYANHVGPYSEEIALTKGADRQLPAGLHPPGSDR